jgi:hypothetical protein
MVVMRSARPTAPTPSVSGATRIDLIDAIITSSRVSLWFFSHRKRRRACGGGIGEQLL